MAQLPPAGTFRWQLSDSLKLLALVPFTTMLEIFRAPAPLFESVKVWATLDVPGTTEPNTTEDDDTSADGEDPIGVTVMALHPEMRAIINARHTADTYL